MYFAVDFTPGGFPIGLRVERIESCAPRFLDGDLGEFHNQIVGLDVFPRAGRSALRSRSALPHRPADVGRGW